MVILNKDELYFDLLNDVKDYVGNVLSEYHSKMPNEFYDNIVADVIECSDYDNGCYSTADIHLAFERVIAKSFGVEI